MQNVECVSLFTVQRLVDIKNRPRIPIPDEDPYSVAGNGGGSGGSSGSSGFGNGNAIVTSPSGIINGGTVAATREQLLLQTQQIAARRSEKPPKLPPRDNMYPHDIPKVSGDWRRRLKICWEAVELWWNDTVLINLYFCYVEDKTLCYVTKIHISLNELGTWILLITIFVISWSINKMINEYILLLVCYKSFI